MIREEWRGLTSFTVILLIFSASFVIGIGAASTSDQNVCRDLPSGTLASGSIITVSLDTTVGSATYYAIDEEVPSGWMVTGASNGGDYTSESGHVKWVVTSGAVDKIYTYTVQIPDDADGTYDFIGEFQMEGMSSFDQVDCDPSITVEGTSIDSVDSTDSTDSIDSDDSSDSNGSDSNGSDDLATITVNGPDPETNDESSSASTESADTTLKSVATTQSTDDSAAEMPAAAEEAGSSMLVIVIGAIVIAGYTLKES